MLIDRYYEAVEALLKTVRETQRENIVKAGELVANAVETGHKVYLGHIVHGIEMDLIISIEVADEKIVERMSGRRTCICGATYHTVYKPSKDNKTCDKCGAELTIRRDDAPEVVLDRLHTYHESTEPLKAYYEKKGKLQLVEGQEELADTTALTEAVITSFLGR